MGAARFYLGGMNWGAAQADIISDGVNGLALSQTGSWTAVDDHAAVRPGAFPFLPVPASDFPRSYRYDLYFVVSAEYGVFGSGNDLQFRLQDTTNAVTLATVAFPSGPGPFFYPFMFVNWQSDVDLLDSGNAVLELQYTLAAPSTANFFVGSFEQFFWVI